MCQKFYLCGKEASLLWVGGEEHAARENPSVKKVEKKIKKRRGRFNDSKKYSTL